MANSKAVPRPARNARTGVIGALGALSAVFAGKAAAQGAEAPAGYDPLTALGEIKEVTQLADGTLQVVLMNGKTIIVSASDFVVVGGEYFIAESSVVALLAAPGGLSAGAIAGGVAVLGGVAAAAGSGGGEDAPPPVAPVFTSGTTATFAENGTGTVYTASATDADSATVTYAITGGADASRFTINATTGVVTFVTPPNFEAPADAGANNVYDLQITASDGTLSTVQTVAVTVTNVNDVAPVFTSGTTATFAENGTGTVYTAAATDADSANLTYSITGGADANLFAIDATTGAVTFVTPPDFEAPADDGANNVYDLQITASDGTLSSVQSVAVTVTNVNDAAPVFTSGTTAMFAENGTGTVYTAAATDADSATVTYAITGGADANLFAIDAATGAVTFVTPPDFEAPTDAGGNNDYDLQVTASDGTLTTVQTVAVTVTNVNDVAPVFTSGATAAFAENGTGTVYTAAATDADSATVTYSITGGADASRFTIDATTGVVTFMTPPDFEAPADDGANNIYDLQITASDGTLTTVQSVAVTVTNVNDAAPVFTSGTTATFAENGTGTVYTAAATDAESATVTYSITGGADAARFTIDATTGVVTFVASPDFEAPTDAGANNVYDLQITASDGTLSTVQNVAVTVSDVREVEVIDLTSLGASRGFIIQGDQSGDRAGYSVSSAGDVNGDGFDDLIVGAFGGGDGGNYAGEAYVVFGGASGFGVDVGGRQVVDLTNLSASQGFIIQGDATFDRAGFSTSSAGDVNGDGFEDLIVGAFTGSDGGSLAGEAYVVFGSAGGFGTNVSGRQVIDLTSLSAAQGFIIQGDAAYDFAGISVSSAGDVNGDGFDDLIVGASSGDDGGTNSGEAYVVFGSASGFGQDVGGRQVIDMTNLSASQGFIIQGDVAFDRSSASVSSAGDVNGDGFDDVIVGAANGGDGGSYAGEAYVVFGSAGGFGASIGGRQVIDLTSLSAAQGFIIQGDEVNDQAGFSVSSAGDVNGDGFDDLVVGAFGGEDGGSDAGEAYVVFGSAGGFGTSIGGRQVIDLTTLSAAQGFIIQGDAPVDQLGRSVSSAGDVNGDGFDDLIVGAERGDDGGNYAGEAYVVFGGADGFGAADGAGRQVIDLTNLSASQGFIIQGDAAFDFAGHSVSSAGDVNGDGFDDLIVGAFGGDDAGTYAGEAYVIFGGATGTESTVAVARTGTGSADNFTGNAGNDTFTGIGANDVVRGGAGNDAISVSALSFADIDGGRGMDTLALSGSGLTLDLTDPGNAGVSSIEVIDLTGSGDNTVILDQQAVFDLTEVRAGGEATLTIRGNAGDTVDLGGATGGFIASGTVADGGITYNVFSHGNATVRVQQGMSALSVPPPPQRIDLSTFSGSQGFIIQGDEAGDQASRSISSAGDVNGDGFDDLIVGAAIGDDGGLGAGEAYVIFGSASGFGASIGGRQVIDLTTLTPAQGFIIQGDIADDLAGYSVSSAGDINGDGFDDLIVGATGGDDAGNSAGEVYVVFGGAGGFGTDVGGRQVIDLTSLSASQGFIIQGDTPFNQLGRSVSSAGDVNGDGFDDLIVSSPLNDNGGTNAGAAYVVFGGAGGFGTDVGGRQVIDLTSLSASQGFIIQGDTSYDFTGNSVSSAGDINGDGFDDLIVGAYGGDDDGSNAGEAYVVFGGAGGFGTDVGGRQVIDLTSLSAAQGFIIQGDAATDQAGQSVSSAGDVNGDGFDDLILGATRGDDGGGNAGEAYVVFGGAGGFGTDVAGRQVIDLTTLSASQGFIIQGDTAYDLTGWSVSSAGDVNGDGFDDVIVGAVAGDDGGANAGEAYVVFGGAGGFGTADGTGRQVIDLTSLNAAQGFIIQGDAAGDLTGWSVSSAGDVNADGFDDLLVGAISGDDGGTDAGEAYVVFGGATGTESTVAVSRMGTSSADNFTGNAGNDTFTGIGAGDVVRGGAGNDAISVSALSFADIDGGRGTDTLALSGSGLTLDLTGPGNAGVSSIEVIDLTGSGNNTVILDQQAVFDLTEVRSGGEATLTIRGNAGDTVSTTDVFTASGSVTDGGVTYNLFTLGNATLRIEQGVTISSVSPAESPDPKGVQVAEPSGTASYWEGRPASATATLEVLEDQPVDLGSGDTGIAAMFESAWTPAGSSLDVLDAIDGSAVDLAIQREAQLAADLLLIDAGFSAQGS